MGEWFTLIYSCFNCNERPAPNPRQRTRTYVVEGDAVVVDARYDDTHAFPSSLSQSPRARSPKTHFPALGNISQGWERCQVYHLGIKDGEKPPASRQFDEARLPGPRESPLQTTHIAKGADWELFPISPTASSRRGRPVVSFLSIDPFSDSPPRFVICSFTSEGELEKWGALVNRMLPPVSRTFRT